MARIKITVERIEGYCNLNMLVGDSIFVEGSKLFIPDGKYMCMWALQAMMPVFPLLNEKDALSDQHWVKGVKHFSCPDPKGRVIYRLERVD
jgi:uncharacterized repeat protein (TIGR04076 family)